MLIFNALTKLQAGLFAALAAVAAPEQPVEELADDVAAPEGDLATDELEFTDAVDPSERARWECYDDWDDHNRGYCLARCEDDWRYKAVTKKIRISGNRDFCKRRARKHCKREGDRLENWCFGERDWDDDDNHHGHH